MYQSRCFYIVYPAIVGLQNLHQRFDYAGRGIEFPGQFSLLLGELDRQYS